MSEIETYPETKIAPYSDYGPLDAEGFVIVKRSDLVGAFDEPLYLWPFEWKGHPERAGVFATHAEAERALKRTVQ